jgi:nucleotide-binding universal stress UspA family protein
MNSSKELDRANLRPSLDFQRLLVTVDEEPLTNKVFDRALELAASYQSCLLIFHCLKQPIPSANAIVNVGTLGTYGNYCSSEMFDLEEKLIEEAMEELKVWLNSFVVKAEGRGISAEFDYQSGDPGKLICQMAKTWQADAIAIGRRGRTGLSEMLLGSVSNYVIHHAPCSVLVVQ